MAELTSLERDVLLFVQLGKSSADIAIILGKQPTTIKVIVMRLAAKLGRR